jgi:shikimate kinase
VRGVASACGSATVVNAIASGRGAAFAVDLRVRAEVALTKKSRKIIGRIADDPRESTKLIEICVKKVLKQLKLDKVYGAKVTTRSQVPIAVGLSSSSAAANATVLATFVALGKKPSATTALNLGVDAAMEAGVTITGAFDDASASFLGGGVVTDNFKRKILKRFKVDPKLMVLIYVPQKKLYTSKIDAKKVKKLANFVNVAHKLALSGDVLSALTMNGLIYSRALGHDPTIAIEALDAGAIAAGLTGKGPAVVAIVEPKNLIDVKKNWSKRAGKIIITKPSKVGAKVEARA